MEVVTDGLMASHADAVIVNGQCMVNYDYVYSSQWLMKATHGKAEACLIKRTTISSGHLGSSSAIHHR